MYAHDIGMLDAELGIRLPAQDQIKVHNQAKLQLGEAEVATDSQTPGASSMNEANNAFASAEKMTDAVAASSHENTPEYRTENGDDDTNMEDIVTGVSTQEKEIEVKNALKTWEQAWSMSSKPHSKEAKGAFMVDVKQAQKAKEGYHKVLSERQKRLSRDAAKAEVKEQTVHDEQVKKFKKQTAMAKASYLAAAANDVAAESRVRQNEDIDIARARKKFQKAQKALTISKRQSKDAIQSAAVAVEQVRQHDIAAHHHPSSTAPVEIKVNQTLSADHNDTLPESVAPALVPPTTVVRAFKEVAEKNGLKISVREIQSGGSDANQNGDAAAKSQAAVQDKMTQSKNDAEDNEQAQDKSKEIRAEQSALKAKLAALSVKAAVKSSSQFAKSALNPDEGKAQ